MQYFHSLFVFFDIPWSKRFGSELLKKGYSHAPLHAKELVLECPSKIANNSFEVDRREKCFQELSKAVQTQYLREKWMQGNLGCGMSNIFISNDPS